jgi:hypothetical protein
MTSAPTIPDATSIPRRLSRARHVENPRERLRLGRIERVSYRLGGPVRTSTGRKNRQYEEE